MQPRSRGSRPRATSSFPLSSPTWGCWLEGGRNARRTLRTGRPLPRKIADMDWSFGGLWPYEARLFESDDGRMHYVDEGPRDGRPVVLLHGNPTWSFLYRNFIPPLTEAGHRAIALDHLGFGRSDKPDRPGLYTIARHCRRANALLDLREATVVPQDWGGPIGLWWATRRPERLRGLFILNTFAHRPRGEVPLPLPLRLFRTLGVGEVMVKGLDLFKRVFLFRAGVVHRERLTPEVRHAYRAPHPSWSSRTPILVSEIEEGLKRDFRSKPVGIAWAMKDIAFTPDVLDQLWLDTFPNADVLRLEDAGHYLQEDAHERIVPALLAQLEDAQPRESRV